MDIHKWLSETVLPQQPPSPLGRRQDCDGPEPERGHREQRRQARATSDSSLLDAPPQRKQVSPSERAALVQDMADETNRPAATYPTSRSESSASSEPYRRKPRRKTRPERYGPAPKDAKERGPDTQQPRKGESKKTRRRPRRMKANKSGSGIVQSFQANNVRKDRLTLKPQEKLGLFNKGRVSSPVKGRGLPDLVFSEMRFLQKHNDKPEFASSPGSPRKRRKKAQTHAKDEEISAYFTSVRPTLAEQEPTSKAKKSCTQRLQGVEHSEQPCIVDKVSSAVEPAEQASYPGFGGRGQRHESESYISWSESVRIRSATPVHLRIGVVKGGQLDSSHGGRKAGNEGDRRMLHSPQAPRAVPQGMKDNSAGYSRAPSLPPTNEHLLRSHSLPQQTSSPCRTNAVDVTAIPHAVVNVGLPFSMPASILNRSETRCEQIHETHAASIPDQQHQLLPVEVLDCIRCPDVRSKQPTELATDTDIRQQRSSSLERILRDCNTAFHEKRLAEALQRHVEEPSPGFPAQRDMRTGMELYPTAPRISSVRFAGVEDTYRPTTLAVSGPSIYEQQDQRQYNIINRMLTPKDTYSISKALQGDYFDEKGFDYDEREGDRAEQLYYDTELFPLANNMETQKMDDSIEGEVLDHATVVGQLGFWRPNKLY